MVGLGPYGRGIQKPDIGLIRVWSPELLHENTIVVTFIFIFVTGKLNRQTKSNGENKIDNTDYLASYGIRNDRLPIACYGVIIVVEDVYS